MSASQFLGTLLVRTSDLVVLHASQALDNLWMITDDRRRQVQVWPDVCCTPSLLSLPPAPPVGCIPSHFLPCTRKHLLAMGGANEKSRSKGARAFQIDAGADALVLLSVFGVELWPRLGSAVSGALHLP
jgi:hypothetical protein